MDQNLSVLRNSVEVTLNAPRDKAVGLGAARLRKMAREAVDAPTDAEIRVVRSGFVDDLWEAVVRVEWSSPAGDRFARI